MPPPTPVASDTAAVTGEKKVAPAGTEKEFVAGVVVVAAAVDAVLEPSCYILLAERRLPGVVEVVARPGAGRSCLLSLEDAQIADVLYCNVM
jgi:hypothetical protein